MFFASAKINTYDEDVQKVEDETTYDFYTITEQGTFYPFNTGIKPTEYTSKRDVDKDPIYIKMTDETNVYNVLASVYNITKETIKNLLSQS